ncbi:MAG: glycosyltransferase involved in cell wall biosynthesis [Paraglaciecola sp.]|jgi:glycosyltransferase involved in cell wall biosynthesis
MRMNLITTLLNTVRLFFYWLLVELAANLSFYRRYQNKSAKKKLALLSFCLPPQFNSGTHRPLSFIKYANENGWEIFSLTNTPDKPITEAGRQLYAELPSGSTITPFIDNFGTTSWQVTPKLDGGFADALSLALRAVKVFKQNPPNVILASAPPFCYAVAAMWLSRMFKIPLVLDYRDEWTLCPFNFVSKTVFDRHMEKRCVAQASLILYTTESHLLAHQEHFFIEPHKQALVYNGWEDKGEKITAPIDIKQDTIRISYIGRLSGHVDLAPFIETLDKAIKHSPALSIPICVEFIGEKSAPLAEQLDAYIRENNLSFSLLSTAQVSKAGALQRMQNSDYLLMLCNQELATYIPGKLYDYLSRRVPIIAYGYYGEVSSILETLEAGRFVIDRDHQQLATALLQPMDSLLDNEVLDSWLQNRTRRNQARRMFEVLKDLP